MADGTYSYRGDALRMPPGETMLPLAVRRISWGSVFAGVAVTLIVQLLFSLLGLAIGMSAVNPAQGDVPVGGLSLGAAIWWVLTSLISLFLGGWVAARLAGIPRHFEGAIHGVLAWTLSTFLSILLLGTVLGTLIGGGFNLIKGGLSGAKQAAAAVLPGMGEDEPGKGGEAARGSLAAAGDSLQAKAEVVLGPGAVDSLKTDSKQLLARVARNPAQAGRLLDSAKDAFSRRGQSMVENRDSLADAVASRTGMSREEARRTVDNYVTSFEQTRAKVDTALDQAREAAAQAGEKAAGGVAKASFWGFFMLLLGGLSAGGGGMLGAPKGVLTARAREENLP